MLLHAQVQKFGRGEGCPRRDEDSCGAEPADSHSDAGSSLGKMAAETESRAGTACSRSSFVRVVGSPFSAFFGGAMADESSEDGR